MILIHKYFLKVKLLLCKTMVVISRVVVMSATVDADKFSNYWNCPVLYIEGRQFPVHIR